MQHDAGQAGAPGPAGASPGWRLGLQGTAQLQHADGRCVVLQRHDAALIAWLALQGATPRETLLALLWPDGDAATLRNRLRQRLFALKQRLGVAPVAGKLSLQLGPDLHWPGLSAEADAEPLLAGHQYDDMPELARWLDQERQHLLAAGRQRIADQAQALEAAGRLAEALPLAARIVSLEPLHEHAHRRLMRLHYLRGDRAAALQVFDACERVLKNELGTRPSEETQALLAQIERSQPPAAVAASRPVPATVLRPPRMVGRDEVWAQLQAAWAQAEAVVIIGEAGMGKTRLLCDLLQAQCGGPGAGLHLAARPGDERVPYALLSRLLRCVLGQRDGPLAAGVQAELARLLPELAARDGAAPAAAGARFVNAVEATLREAAQTGLQAVALDDLHFSDDASLELAQHLAGAVPLRWLLALRPEAPDSGARTRADALAAQLRGTVVRLAPLSVAQVDELLASLDLATPSPRSLPQALHRHTGGNPLFVLETLKLLLQGDAAAGGLVRGPAERLPTAAGVGRLVQRRIAQLSPLAVKLVRCAAIAGQDFNVHLAAHVLGLRVIDLADAWGELETAQVLRDNGFAHDLVHEAALASVPEAIAQSLHGEVAGWLEGHAGEPARVAHHWQQAGRAERAGPAWLQAAERCAARGRRAEESQLLARAAAAFGQAGELRARSSALLRRAYVIGQHADFASARCALDDAAAAVVDDEDRLRLAVVDTNTRAMHGDEAHTLAHAPAALELARSLGRHDAVLSLTMCYSGALSRNARSAEAVELLADLRPWLDAHADLDQQRRYWNATALALDQSSRMREAMQAWQRTLEFATRDGSDLLCQVLGNMAYTSAKMGDVERAAALGERALDLAQGASDGFDHQVLQQQLALGHHLRNAGRYAEAVRLLEAAAAGFRKGGDALQCNAAEHLLAIAWLHLGQPARALQLLSGEASAPLPRVRAMRLAFRALARHAAGQPALEPLREALALLNEPENLWFRTHTLIATAIVPADEGEPLATGLASWALARERYGLALAAHARAARCALVLGAPARAAPHVDTALQLAQKYQPDVYYLPELWWVAAQVHAATGQDATRQRLLVDGARWVRHAAEQHVAPEFRDSFLQRNRINADLLHWAAATAS